MTQAANPFAVPASLPEPFDSVAKCNNGQGRSRAMHRRHLIVLASLLNVALALPADGQPYRERGEVLARGMCAGCHAIGRTGDSAHPAAPRFRSLGNQVDLSKLAQRIREGLLTGHEDMPMFRFDREDANAMAAYIRSIQAR